MRVFIDFWKLEIENSILHVFNFLRKLSFENNLCFLSILSCQTSFLVLKIKNCFWKQEIKGKNSYQTYLCFGNWKHLKCILSFYNSSLKNQRIKWWKQNLKTMSNRLLNHETHIFWVMCDENRVMSDGNTKTKQSLSNQLLLNKFLKKIKKQLLNNYVRFALITFQTRVSWFLIHLCRESLHRVQNVEYFMLLITWTRLQQCKHGTLLLCPFNSIKECTQIYFEKTA